MTPGRRVRRRPAPWPSPRLLLDRDRLPADLERVVEAKLRRLLRHAGTAVPWYRRLFAEAGVDPRRAGLAELGRLPITRKAHWRDRFGPEFFSEPLPRTPSGWVRSSGTTGGAIGMPFLLPDRVARRISTQRCLWAAGLGVRSRYAWVRTGSRQRMTPSWFQRLGVLRTLYLDLHAGPEAWWDALLAWAPGGLIGFPLETEAVATRILDGRLARPRDPVVCALYGEHVDARTRATVEAALGPLREIYGSSEAGTIAWECGRGPGMHVNADLVIVEFVREGRPVPPGTPGEVVVTNLHSWAMPVVRYGQGDVGWEVAGPCPCGRPGPLMRVEPSFRLGPLHLPSGRRVSARFMVQAMPSPGWLLRWEVEQPEPDLIRLGLVVAQPVPGDELRRIASLVARAAWEPIRVEVRIAGIEAPAGPFSEASRRAAPS